MTVQDLIEIHKRIHYLREKFKYEDNRIIKNKIKIEGISLRKKYEDGIKKYKIALLKNTNNDIVHLIDTLL